MRKAVTELAQVIENSFFAYMQSQMTCQFRFSHYSLANGIICCQLRWTMQRKGQGLLSTIALLGWLCTTGKAVPPL